ncbi:MAG: hypothetical protein ACRDYE_01870 [Acidimicrobiales bacterium]
MGAAVAFDRRLGLTIPDADDEFQAHHRNAELPGGAGLHFDSVEFAGHWDKGWHGGMGVLGFSVQSRERVDEIYADLPAPGTGANRSHTTPSGVPATPWSKTRMGTRWGS